MNRIYFFANFGDWDKVPYGGGEVGNRRTLSFLKEGHFNVIAIPKYLRVENHSFANLIKLGCKIIGNIFKFFLVLIFGTRKNSLVHIAGFYGPMIYFEYILISISRFLGYTSIYEMRGGGADTYFKEGSITYKKYFRKALLKSNVIFTQGLENIPLIKQINPDIEVFYYPNCVTKEFYPSQYPEKPTNRINLFYFGRISQTKNVNIVIDTFIELHSQFKNVFLSIVGNYNDENYMNSLKDKITKNKLDNYIQIFPACNHEELKKHLADKHFYIFPSTEPHEGHSNALTEAMAWGLIPIATPQGFNRSVINNDNLIVKELNCKEFAQIIASIIANNQITSLSLQMFERIMNYYTDKIVYQQLITEYKQLFKQMPQ